MNAWLFLTLLFPLYSVFVADEHRARNRQNLALVFLVAAIWLSVKTFIFLFFFSHNLVGSVAITDAWLNFKPFLIITNNKYK